MRTGNTEWRWVKRFAEQFALNGMKAGDECIGLLLVADCKLGQLLAVNLHQPRLERICAAAAAAAAAAVGVGSGLPCCCCCRRDGGCSWIQGEIGCQGPELFRGEQLPRVLALTHKTQRHRLNPP